MDNLELEVIWSCAEEECEETSQTSLILDNSEQQASRLSKRDIAENHNMGDVRSKELADEDVQRGAFSRKENKIFIADVWAP